MTIIYHFSIYLTLNLVFQLSSLTWKVTFMVSVNHQNVPLVSLLPEDSKIKKALMVLICYDTCLSKTEYGSRFKSNMAKYFSLHCFMNDTQYVCVICSVHHMVEYN